jgi:hypothetical protein
MEDIMANGFSNIPSNIRVPVEPAQPNWAQRSGVLGLLASTLQQVQRDYEYEMARKEQERKLAAEKERTGMYVQAQRDVARMQGQQSLEEQYFKNLTDRLNDTTFMASNPEAYKAALAEYERFVGEKGLTAPMQVDQTKLDQYLEQWRKVEEDNDWSEFADLGEKQVEEAIRDRYKDKAEAARKMNDYNAWRREQGLAGGKGAAIKGWLRGEVPEGTVISRRPQGYPPPEQRNIAGWFGYGAESAGKGLRRFYGYPLKALSSGLAAYSQAQPTKESLMRATQLLQQHMRTTDWRGRPLTPPPTSNFVMPKTTLPVPQEGGK